MRNLATLVLKSGQARLAAQLFGFAEELINSMRRQVEFSISSIYQKFWEETQARLGEAAYQTAFKEGQSWNLDQALTYFYTAKLPLENTSAATTVTPPASPSPTSNRLLEELTEREREVLGLIAQGLTNAQIAQQLIISPHTVSTHLRSIYDKLDLNSRSAATRYALEHHLV